MKANLLGVETFEYTQKETGERKTVCILHVVHPKNKVKGLAVEIVRIYKGSDCFDKCIALEPKSRIDIDFDSRGFVTDVDIVQAADNSSALEPSSDLPKSSTSGKPKN